MYDESESFMNLIQILEQEEIQRLTEGKTIPEFNPGDSVVVNVNVIEGNRSVLRLTRAWLLLSVIVV